MTGELHPVYDGLDDAAAVTAEHVAHLGGADVLALPAERVAEAVAEEPAAVGVAAQRVTSAEVGVALLEDIAGDLGVGGALIVPVAAERAPRQLALVVEADEDLAALVEGDARREARVRVAQQLARLRVRGGGHVHAREEGAQQQAVHAERLGREVAPARVVEPEHELRRVEELVDRVDAEPVPERDPHVAAQPVAQDRVHVVGAVQRRRRLREQVPQGLAHVDEECCARGADVGPEGARAELRGDA